MDRKEKNIEIFTDTLKQIDENQRLQEAIKDSVSRQKLYLEEDEVMLPASKDNPNLHKIM